MAATFGELSAQGVRECLIEAATIQLRDIRCGSAIKLLKHTVIGIGGLGFT